MLANVTHMATIENQPTRLLMVPSCGLISASCSVILLNCNSRRTDAQLCSPPCLRTCNPAMSAGVNNETHVIQCDAVGRTARRHRRWAEAHRSGYRNRRQGTAQEQYL